MEDIIDAYMGMFEEPPALHVLHKAFTFRQEHDDYEIYGDDGVIIVESDDDQLELTVPSSNPSPIDAIRQQYEEWFDTPLSSSEIDRVMSMIYMFGLPVDMHRDDNQMIIEFPHVTHGIPAFSINVEPVSLSEIEQWYRVRDQDASLDEAVTAYLHQVGPHAPAPSLPEMASRTLSVCETSGVRRDAVVGFWRALEEAGGRFSLSLPDAYEVTMTMQDVTIQTYSDTLVVGPDTYEVYDEGLA